MLQLFMELIMGCLKNLFGLVIIILAAIGFVAIGGIDFVMNGLNGIIK